MDAKKNQKARQGADEDFKNSDPIPDHILYFVAKGNCFPATLRTSTTPFAPIRGNS
jgi:hypothetical protein